MFGKVNILFAIDAGYRRSIIKHNKLVDRNRHALNGIIKKKEIVAEERKRRKQEAKEPEKLKKFFVPFFKRCSSANIADNPISKVQSDQYEQQPVEVGQSKQESEEIGQSEKEIGNVLNVNEEPKSDVRDFISNRDVGLMNFDKNTGKPILSNRMRAEITKLGSKYFQNIHGLFYPKIIVQ